MEEKSISFQGKMTSRVECVVYWLCLKHLFTIVTEEKLQSLEIKPFKVVNKNHLIIKTNQPRNVWISTEKSRHSWTRIKKVKLIESYDMKVHIRKPKIFCKLLSSHIDST